MRDERNHLDLIASHESVRALSRVFRDGGHAACAGAAGSSTALVVGAAARETARMAVLVVAHLDDADEVVDELSACGVGASKLPALEVLPGESGVSMELFAERIAVTRLMLGMGKAGTTREGDRAGGMVIVCPIQALMQGVPGAGKLDDVSLRLEAGGDSRASNSPTALNTSKVRGLSAVVRWLDGAGYRRTEAIEEPGDFAVRGGILDVFMPGGGGGATSATAGDGAAVTVGAVRVDFFGDDVESITEINLETMGSGSKLRAVELVAADPARVASDEGTVCFLELLPTDAAAVISETMEVTEQGRGYYERVTDARGIYGPPAVIKLLRERFHAFVEVNQFGGSRAGAAAGAGQTSIDLPARLLPEFAKDVGEAVNELAAMSAGHRVVVLCQNEGERSRLDELLGEFAPGAAGKIERAVRYLHRGFVWGEEGGRAESGSRKSRDGDAPLALVPYHELLHRYQARRRVRRLKPGRASEVFLDVQAGDYVVHTDHGIAQFVGLKSIKPRGVKGTAEERAEERLKAQSENLKSQISSLKSLRSNAPSAPEKGRHADAVAGSANDRPEAGSRKPEASGAKPDADVEEFLTLEFAGGTKLHVPVSQISKVQKYIGGFRGKPPLSTLGGTKWESQKNRVKESVRDLAKELLRVQAARESMPGVRYPSDTAWQTEFEAEFPYEETEDQLAALAEIKKDMGASRPMD
ncbi:MAG TPA: CarD family transcriptional regulator, partial [Phycisphaerales bacterium]|nr:CarD family transcriptional regulator [Phycisphaerales bacterium]